MPRRVTLLCRFLLVASVAAITFLALTSAPVRMVGDVNDKVQHAAAFYALTLLLDFSFPDRPLGAAKLSGLLAYGVLLEVWQMLAPPRDPSLWDVVADLIGIALYAWSQPVLRYLPIMKGRWESVSSEQ
ncbi:MAG TPA: VanZ family protein [Gemmatimonadales bacterium]